MKKNLLISVLFLSSTLAWAQDIVVTKINDWNTLRKPGFYESNSSDIINAPTDKAWFWGINIAHSANTVVQNRYYYGAQILFPIKDKPIMIPDMYIRSMTWDGSGMWAKVLHSKGNHAIDGKLTAKEIEIKVNTGADFVFKTDYELRSLSEVEAFVKENQHLPEIPSEKDMIENGVNVNEMQIKLLQKIEELTLYVIEQDKKIMELEKRMKH